MTLLGPDDVCKQLGIKKRTLYEMVQNRRIEHFKMGNQLRFRQEQVDAWLESKIVPVRKPRNLRQVS